MTRVIPQGPGRSAPPLGFRAIRARRALARSEPSERPGARLTEGKE